MPAGWSQEPNEDEEADQGSDCLDQVFGPPSEDAANVRFSQSQLGPFLVFSAAGEDRIGKFDDLSAAVAACDGFTDSDGNTWSVMPLSFPKIGDETFAFRADIGGGSLPASVHIVLVRVNEVVMLGGGIAVMGAPIDSELMTELLQAMAERASAAG